MYCVFSLPNSLSTLAHLVSLQLDGNPIRSIRRDIIQSGTARILKMLRDRSAQDESKLEVKSVACIGEDESTLPDMYEI